MAFLIKVSLLLLTIINHISFAFLFSNSLFRSQIHYKLDKLTTQLHLQSTSTTSNNIQDSELLPVTILSGFLGAGKTTLLNQILKNDHNGKRYAVIVNDLGEVNIDSKLIQPHIKQQKEELVELSNGCICCTLREDLLREVAQLAKQKKFDHLIIESTGVSEPLPVAETFSFDLEDNVGMSFEGKSFNESLLGLARIDSMITVVDAYNFLNNMNDAYDLSKIGMQAREDDTRTITDLLTSQIEFSDVIILNKCDMVSETQKLAVKQMIRSLNANAEIIESIKCNVNIGDIIGRNLYDFEKVSQSAAWIQAMNDNHNQVPHTPETEEYGISSFVFRARRPFHPERLMEFINTELASNSDDDDDDDDEIVENDDDKRSSNIHKESSDETLPIPSLTTPTVLRSKGFFWLATRYKESLQWSQAGGLFRISPGGYWWVDTPKELWPEGSEEVAQIMADFDTANVELGDRRQEIVLIGAHLDQADLRSKLGLCLLTDEEMVDPTKWEMYEDPFPPSDFEDDDHDDDDDDEEDVSVDGFEIDFVTSVNEV